MKHQRLLAGIASVVMLACGGRDAARGVSPTPDRASAPSSSAAGLIFTALPPSLPDPHVVGPKPKRVGIGRLTIEPVRYAGDGKSGPLSLEILEDGRVRVDGKHVATISGMHVTSPRGAGLLTLAEDGRVTGADGIALGRLGPMIVATDPARQEALLLPQGGLAVYLDNDGVPMSALDKAAPSGATPLVTVKGASSLEGGRRAALFAWIAAARVDAAPSLRKLRALLDEAAAPP